MTIRRAKELCSLFSEKYPIRCGIERFIVFYTKSGNRTTGYYFTVSLPYATTGIGHCITMHLSMPKIKSMTEQNFIDWIKDYKHMILMRYKVAI